MFIFVDEERTSLLPGYDFSFAPCRPQDPEYRQMYGERHLKWLAQWEPSFESFPQ